VCDSSDSESVIPDRRDLLRKVGAAAVAGLVTSDIGLDASAEAHNAIPYVKAWFAKLPDLAQGGVTVMRMTISGNSRN